MVVQGPKITITQKTRSNPSGSRNKNARGSTGAFPLLGSESPARSAQLGLEKIDYPYYLRDAEAQEMCYGDSRVPSKKALDKKYQVDDYR
jgi:hypothetical protein